MAAPLRRGGALARQRLTGLAFLGVLVGLVLLSVALYEKRFTPVVLVELSTDSVGNQLTENGDVKVRGVLVGTIREVRSTGDGATVLLAIDEDRAALVPDDAVARLLPKTLFGEKFVALSTTGATGDPVSDGDVLQQDRSAEGIETERVLDDLMPLLQSLEPDQLSTTLGALSTTLRGRGEALGANLERTGAYLEQLNPALPEIQQDLVGLADLADTYDAAAPDLLTVLDDLSFSSRSLLDQEDEFSGFLRDSDAFSGSLQSLLADNEQRLVSLAAESLPVLGVYARYSPGYACLLQSVEAADDVTERTFGGLQPGLHITLEPTRDLEGFSPGEEPLYADDRGPTCRGLTEPREIPFPVYVNPDDGYRDGAEVDPSTGREVGDDGPGLPAPPGPLGALSAQSRGSVLALAAAPVLGVPPEEVGGLAELLLGPMARGATLSLER